MWPKRSACRNVNSSTFFAAPSNGVNAGRSPSVPRRQRHRLGDLAGVDALAGEQLDREPVGVVEHRQQQVIGVDLGVAGLVRLVLGADDDIARPRGESAEAGVGIERVGIAGGLWDEALLGGLLGDAHALADLGPRRPGSSGLVDEVADEVIGDLAQGLGGQHRVGELLERFLVHLLDDVDEVVEADGVGDLGGLGHGVNSRLTMWNRQPVVDACG